MNYGVLHGAKIHVQRLREIQNNYDAECETDRKEGHRPHYCIHGMNLWVDYDPICGPCEDGYSRYEGRVLYELALQFAHLDHEQMTQRVLLVTPLAGRVPAEIWESLTNWALEERH